MCENYEKIVGSIFFDFESLCYRAEAALNDEDMELFADRIRQCSDSFYSILFRKHKNSCFKSLDLIVKE